MRNIWPWIELILVMLVLVFGLLSLLKIYSTGRDRKEVWSVFHQVAKDMDLEIKDGPPTGYGYPDLYGTVQGREVYVHPVEGKGKNHGSTVYGVRNKIDFKGDIIVTSPETTIIEDEVSVLDVPSLSKKGLEIRSDIRSNQGLARKLFNDKTVRKLKRMIDEEGDDFRALIIEPGVCMFSTHEVPKDTSVIEERIVDTVELVDRLEGNSPSIKAKVSSERFDRIATKYHASLFDLAMMIGVFLLGFYLLLSIPMGFSWIFLNLGAMLVLVSLTRISILITTRNWLDL